MKVVIPLKTNSIRVPDKNLRPFHEGRSLFDLRAAQLLRVFEPRDVYVSSEAARVEPLVRRYGFTFLPREKRLTCDDMPFGEVVTSLFAQVPGEDDLLWTSVTDPMFDRFADVLATWEKARVDGYDSLLVVRPLRAFVLHADGRPLNHGFGPWHVTSQGLGLLYTHNFACQIVTREAARRCGYLIGSRPYLYEYDGPEADIDTLDDFHAAGAMYASFAQKTEQPTCSPRPS